MGCGHWERAWGSAGAGGAAAAGAGGLEEELDVALELLLEREEALAQEEALLSC